MATKKRATAIPDLPHSTVDSNCQTQEEIDKNTRCLFRTKIHTEDNNKTIKHFLKEPYKDPKLQEAYTCDWNHIAVNNITFGDSMNSQTGPAEYTPQCIPCPKNHPFLKPQDGYTGNCVCKNGATPEQHTRSAFGVNVCDVNGKPNTN